MEKASRSHWLVESRLAAAGRRPSLSPKEMKKLESKLIKNPFATNAELAAEIKNKITPQAVGKVVKKSAHQFTWKLEEVDVEASFSPEVAKQGREFFAKVRRTPESQRIYVDETFISPGIKRRRGRFPKGKKPWSPRNRKYKRIVIIGAVTKEGWLHPGRIFNKGSITDKDFESYVSRTLRPHLSPEHTVLWDRYGRSGRAKNPTARHFSPKAKRTIESTGAKLLMLPPYGKLGDPIEMVFGDTKRNFEKRLAKKLETCMPSKIPFEFMKATWRAAEKEVSPQSFHRAFKERANGQEFNRVCQERGLA